MNFIKYIYEKPITKMIILTVVLINLLIFYSYLTSRIGIETTDLQNVYYFFSTSAQSIATFIAFLIAGYALVYQAMDNLENRDDTLIDIHHKIKMEYYKKIKWLACLTGITVILCLIMIWLNGYNIDLKNYFAVITIIFIILTVFFALWFVIYIIDPEKIRKAARQLIKEKYSLQGGAVDEGDLIKEFIALERNMRNAVLDYQLQGRNQSRHREIISFREILEIFFSNGLIDRDFYNDLKEISNYRNLIVHGHIEKVDESMLHKTHEALEKINYVIKEDLPQIIVIN